MLSHAQIAGDQKRLEAEIRLSDKANDLANLIRTMPPEDFMELVGELNWRCAQIVASVDRDPLIVERSDLEETIRELLANVAVLAWKFDASPWNSAYAANIMLFRSCEGLDEKQRSDLLSRLKFCGDSHLEDLHGVLDLDQQLSAVITNDSMVGKRPDDSLAALALPIPKTNQWINDDKTRWRVLPGAPFAYVKALALKKPLIDLCRDSAGLADWCRKNGDFTPTVISQIGQYFDGGKIASFASLPLQRPDPEAPIVGVLNLHSNRKGFLRQKIGPYARGQVDDLDGTNVPAEHFCSMISPTLFSLARLLELRQIASEAHHARR
jgi:hypothetical protein